MDDMLFSLIICCVICVIHHPPSTIHHPPFTIHHPPSTIHLLLLDIAHFIRCLLLKKLFFKIYFLISIEKGLGTGCGGGGAGLVRRCPSRVWRGPNASSQFTVTFASGTVLHADLFLDRYSIIFILKLYFI